MIDFLLNLFIASLIVDVVLIAVLGIVCIVLKAKDLK